VLHLRIVALRAVADLRPHHLGRRCVRGRTRPESRHAQPPVRPQRRSMMSVRWATSPNVIE
jgi:hypothetical protein